MVIRIRTREGKTLVIDDASLMIVEDASGNPVSIASEFGMGDNFVVSCVDDLPKHNRILRNLGIDKVVITETIDDFLKPKNELTPLYTP